MLVLSTSLTPHDVLEEPSSKQKERQSPSSVMSIIVGLTPKLKRMRSFEDVFVERHRLELASLKKQKTAEQLAGQTVNSDGDDEFVWRCKNTTCYNRDRESLVLTEDKASMACPECGIVDGAAQPISATFEANARTELSKVDAEESTKLGRFDSMLGTSDEKRAKRVKMVSSTGVGGKDKEIQRKQYSLSNERAKELQRQQAGLDDSQLKRRDKIITEIAGIFRSGGRNIDSCPFFDQTCFLTCSQFARGIAHADRCTDCGCKVGFAARRHTTIARECIYQTYVSCLKQAETGCVYDLNRSQIVCVLSTVIELIRAYTSHPSALVVRNELKALQSLSSTQLLEPCICETTSLTNDDDDGADESTTTTIGQPNNNDVADSCTVFEAKLGIAFESIVSLGWAPEHVARLSKEVSLSVSAYTWINSVKTSWKVDIVALMLTLASLPSALHTSRSAVCEYTLKLRTQLFALARTVRISDQTIDQKLRELDPIIQKNRSQQQQQQQQSADPWD